MYGDEVATLFWMKMLTLGLKVLSQKFPQGLVSGPLPESCRPSPPQTGRATARQSSGSRLKTASSQPTVPVSHPQGFSSDSKNEYLKPQLHKSCYLIVLWATSLLIFNYLRFGSHSK